MLQQISIKAVAGGVAGLCALVLAGIYVPDPATDSALRGVLAVGGSAALAALGMWASTKVGAKKAPEQGK